MSCHLTLILTRSSNSAIFNSMKDFSAADTLLTALPVLLVLLALVGAVIFFPEGSILDIRGRAAPVRPAPTIIAVPTTTQTPETGCSDLYKPVCRTVNN